MILRRNLMKKTRKSRVFRVEFRVSKLEKSSFSSRVSSRVYSKSRVFRVGFRVWVLKTRTWLETRKKSSSIVWSWPRSVMTRLGHDPILKFGSRPYWVMTRARVMTEFLKIYNKYSGTFTRPGSRSWPNLFFGSWPSRVMTGWVMTAVGSWPRFYFGSWPEPVMTRARVSDPGQWPTTLHYTENSIGWPINYWRWEVVTLRRTQKFCADEIYDIHRRDVT